MINGGYQDLDVWQKSRQLATVVYDVARRFPPSEQFALANQLRRCAVSIPSNIAEGWGRSSTQDFIRFLRIAKGSLMELETQIILACDFGYIDTANQVKILQSTDELSRMMTVTVKGLIKRQEARASFNASSTPNS